MKRTGQSKQSNQSHQPHAAKVRRLFTVSLLTAAFSATAALADSPIDLSAYSDAEVIDLLDAVQAEVAERHIEKTADLPSGTYIGGNEIPPGSYIITKLNVEDNGFIWLRDVADPEGSNPSKLGEYVSTDEPATFYVTINEGDTLYLEFEATLTISPGITFK